MLRYEPNGEVHCKLFYNAKLLKEGIFSKWREAGWPINTLFWISERGGNKFHVFGRGTQKGGDMYQVVGWASL